MVVVSYVIVKYYHFFYYVNVYTNFIFFIVLDLKC